MPVCGVGIAHIGLVERMGACAGIPGIFHCELSVALGHEAMPGPDWLGPGRVYINGIFGGREMSLREVTWHLCESREAEDPKTTPKPLVVEMDDLFLLRVGRAVK